ncbi:fungal-specific transcription factor domain-containing protein [Thelonectria olida]|uniref:Fungal-specific transcription factor domain-containing protein n=1 Tax=Thelonectria olida TaxID=1576542 RepID=A0A9P8W706_9HYPO|nr:fungal-specific transcription factor domain-containing protein [Thelonectria olida]
MPGSSLSEADQTNNGRKARTKTFSGCWTCRAKHVKCDESRPVCNRCRRSGLSCEGYGVRLSWISVRGPSNFRSRGASARKAGRMQVSKASQAQEATPGEQSTLQPSPTGDDRQDNRESTIASEGSTQPETGGSVMDLGPSPEEESPSGELNNRINQSYKVLGQDLTARTSHHSHAPPRRQAIEHSRSRNDASDIQPSGTGVASGETSGSLHSNDQNDEQQDITWLPPRRSTSPPATQLSNHGNQQLNIPSPGTPLRHLDVLPNPGLQCQLLEHWTLHLCDALNPVPGVHNPMRTIMMPIALEGARADLKTSTGATALFHLICSASAFHLSQRSTPESKRELESAALEHHNLGITHLGQNIQSDDRSQCVPLLASLVMCILNEAITVPTPFWRLHFRGAVEWVNHINPQVWHQTESASVIYQMFIGMATLVQCQLLLDGREAFLWDLPYDPLTQPEPYCLDMAFGMPQPVMQCLQTINAMQMEDKRSNGPPNPSRAQDFDRLEVELFLSTPKKPSSAVGKEYGDLVYHHGYTYYFAALIYMKRTVKDTPIEDVQALIEQSLYHMEAIETSTDRPFSPMLWPMAILAFETTHTMPQNRILKCLETFADRSGFAIWTQLANLVRDLWALRKTEGNSRMKWHRSVLTSMNDSFMLL